MIKLHNVGRSLKSHGNAGQLSIFVQEPFIERVLAARAIFIDLDGSRVPFLIEEIEHRHKMLVKLDDIDSPEQVIPLASREIYMPFEEVKDVIPEGNGYKAALEGFRIIDPSGQERGLIHHIEEYPHQVMATVVYREKEYQLPLHENLVIDIDQEQKVLHYEIPEGLISLNP